MFFIVVVAVCLLLILWCSAEAGVSIIKFVRSLFDKSYNLDRLDCFGNIIHIVSFSFLHQFIQYCSFVVSYKLRQGYGYNYIQGTNG